MRPDHGRAFLLRAGELPGAALALLLPVVSAAQQPTAAGAEALRAGRYEEAMKLYREALGRDPASAPARLGLAEALRLTGAYPEALEALAPAGNQPEILVAEAHIHLETGAGEAARAALTRAREAADEADPSTSVEVSGLLGRLELRLGERAAGLARLDEVLDAYNRSPPGTLSPRALTAVGQAAVALGFQSSGLFRDALRVFDEAAALDPHDPLPVLAAGELLFDKFNTAEAGDSFASVLSKNPRHPRALVGAARIRRPGVGGASPGGPAAAMEIADPLEMALAVNPDFPPARALEVERLLERERYEEAGERARAAVRATPGAPETLAALASFAFLSGETDELEGIRGRYAAAWPGDPRLDVALGRAAERQRRYREAAGFAGNALAGSPESAAAARLLGLNLLRLGDMARGREVLEAAFLRDPFDALLKNNLDLLDELDGFRTIRKPPFEFVLPESEADLLAPYVEELAREALEDFGTRYGFEPGGTVRLEMYDRSADFSVRTVGITGIGAHGVCFGRTIAMESPSARPVAEYHWASTFWHEFGHTVAMGMTDNRVPRWFTEGLSVLEERKRFGDGANLLFLTALRDGRLLDVKDLNDGFTFPTFPGQVQVSYFHASLVLEQIERDHGFDAILGVLGAFREGKDTGEALIAVLGMDAAALDAAVDATIEARYGAAARSIGAAPSSGSDRPPPAVSGTELDAVLITAAASPEDFVARMRAGIALFEAGRDADAADHLEEAAAILPSYGGADSPLRYLASIHERNGRPGEARKALSGYLARFPAAYAGWLRLAEMRTASADPEGAARALEAAIGAYPLLADPHEKLAGLAAASGRHAIELRERKAVLATDPPDRAGALHQLAAAHFRAGEHTAARRRVLEALEVAPTYEPALRLLLRLRREG